MPLFDRIAAFLQSQTELVDVASSPAPLANQVLTASGPTAAFWNLPAGGVNPFTADAKQTVATATNSLVDILLSGMSLTPGAGNFLVWFSANASNSNAAQSAIFSIYVNGVQVVGTERFRRAVATNALTEITVLGYVPGVLAGQAIEIYWRVTGNSATVGNREMIVMRVA